MTPQEFLDKAKNKTEQLIHNDVTKIEQDTDQIARIIQTKVLGFTVDTRYGHITDVSEEYMEELLQSSRKEIEILKTKIKISAANKLKSIKDMHIPDVINHRFEQEINEMIISEQNKIRPIIQKIIKQSMQEQILKPWILTAKMQGIDTDEILGINKGSNINKDDDDLPF